MTEVKTMLIQKNPKKNVLSNNRSVRCLQMMRKILTAQMKEDI